MHVNQFTHRHRGEIHETVRTPWRSHCLMNLASMTVAIAGGFVNIHHTIPPTNTNKLAEVASLFLRLGFTAFGGPAAHIAMMRTEVVQRRQWINDERFLDLLSVVNL